MLLVNLLAPGKYEWNFRYLILQIISVIDGWGISCELALIWMNVTRPYWWPVNIGSGNDCQATSHYLSQCWPRSLSPYGVTRPQWVKSEWLYLDYNLTKYCSYGQNWQVIMGSINVFSAEQTIRPFQMLLKIRIPPPNSKISNNLVTLIFGLLTCKWYMTHHDANDHLCLIWKESIHDCMCRTRCAIFLQFHCKVMAEWPWRYRPRSKVVAQKTLSNASDHWYLIWEESILNCCSCRVDTKRCAIF